MSTIYVLNKDGKPLMPTTRGGRVRHLLKERKARVVQSKPFTIRLLYEVKDVVQPLYLGIDPGRTNIGVAVVKADGTTVFTAHLETRNKEIPKLMKKRKESRRARRTNGREDKLLATVKTLEDEREQNQYHGSGGFRDGDEILHELNEWLMCQ